MQCSSVEILTCDYFAELDVRALELMPVAQWPGECN
jgi:1,4-alpha-glucan branching enzyme